MLNVDDAMLLAVDPLAKKKTAIDETFVYPDFAVEVCVCVCCRLKHVENLR